MSNSSQILKAGSNSSTDNLSKQITMSNIEYNL